VRRPHSKLIWEVNLRDPATIERVFEAGLLERRGLTCWKELEDQHRGNAGGWLRVQLEIAGELWSLRKYRARSFKGGGQMWRCGGVGVLSSAPDMALNTESFGPPAVT